MIYKTENLYTGPPRYIKPNDIYLEHKMSYCCACPDGSYKIQNNILNLLTLIKENEKLLKSYLLVSVMTI